MEEILGEIPFRPFSILTITNQRIIGKRLIPIGPNRFEGEILIENILNLKFVPALRFTQNPSLTIWHKEETGKILDFIIHFHGLSARLAGFDAEKIYKLLLNLIQKSNPEKIT